MAEGIQIRVLIKYKLFYNNLLMENRYNNEKNGIPVKVSNLQAWVQSHFSHVQLCMTPRTVDHQAPLPEFFRQEHWSGLLFPSPHIYITGAKYLVFSIG